MENTATTRFSEKRRQQLLRVLEKVTARRLAGDSLTDEVVIKQHPDLMPDLRERLDDLSLAERARQTAVDSGIAHWDSSNDSPPSRTRTQDFLPTDAFDGYNIEAEIGSGAMGVVYRAHQKATQRKVAIKVMVEGPFAGATDRARFQREAQILGQLNHPHLITIHDSGVTAGRFFMVMDYVDGPTFDQFLAPSTFSVNDKIELFAKVCDAVHAAHLRGVIHRDLKPSNIRVGSDGQPQVLDFGLAKLEDQPGAPNRLEQSMTLTGQFVGSLPWASPEQAEGTPDQVDLRTDVYSLGVILYQILTKQFPYPVIGHLRSVIENIVSADPQRPSLIVPINDDLETIVLKCLAKDPMRRYQSAADLSRDLHHYLANEPIDAKRDSGWYILRKSMRRHRWAVGIASTLLVLITGFGITMTLMYRHAEEQADRATRTLAFLQETLFDANSRELGPDSTLMQVLQEAAKRTDVEFQSEPGLAAAIHFTIGDAYESIWSRGQAVVHLRKALDLFEKTYGPTHPDALKTKVLLGMVLAELRDPKSVDLEKVALDARLATLGSEHVLIADSKSNLAFTYWSAAIPRKWQEAEQLYEEALAMYSRLLGPEHPDIARCLYAFGAMQHALRNLGRASKLFESAYHMSEKLLGAENQFTLECALGYANLLHQRKRFDLAEPLLRDLLVRVPKRFGESRKPSVMRQMADLELNRKNYAQAQRWHCEALALSLQQLIPEHPEHASELNRHANQILATATDLNQIPPYRRTIEATVRISGNAVFGANALMDVSSLLKLQGHDEETERVLRNAIEYIKKFPMENRIFAQYATSAHGQSLRVLNRFDEAEPLLLSAHADLASELTYSHPLARDALRRLIDLYDAWGKPDKAEEFRTVQKEQVVGVYRPSP